ncbi:MAG: DUF1810 domain-containing protein [Verrucomicrobiota bacterium]|nr:DUF1810 domain-containing protein [Verrucomicrobiota bacterium]
MSFARFHEAQADPHAGYDTALAEIRRGRKTSHWIWDIFPQLSGLGHSQMATRYAIRDLAEACDYLRDPLLRARYEAITTAVGDQLALGRRSTGEGGRGLALEDLMGSRIDALKLVSSLTLFRAASERLAHGDPTFHESLVVVIDFIFNQPALQNYPPCDRSASAG